MGTLLLAVGIVIVLSAACSLAEAALYTVRMPYVRQLVQSGSKAGVRLEALKRNIERPITAILVINTAAHTAGAAVAGAQAREVLGEASVVWFSAAFTVAVLFLSEILPKILGVAYNRLIATFISAPLNAAIILLYPLVVLTERAASFLQRSPREPAATEQDVEHLAAISAEEGSILPVEAELVRNVLKLNQVMARDILTPRNVVVGLPATLTVGDVATQAPQWPFARIPLFIGTGLVADDWCGVVLRRDVLGRLAKDEFAMPIRRLSGPLDFVWDDTRGHVLLNEFVRRRRHMFGVRDRSGHMVGVVTLEDVLESLIGAEIVDETDIQVDMREAARRVGNADNDASAD